MFTTNQFGRLLHILFAIGASKRNIIASLSGMLHYYLYNMVLECQSGYMQNRAIQVLVLQF